MTTRGDDGRDGDAAGDGGSRERLITRLIAIDRGLHAVLFASAAALLITVSRDLTRFQHMAQQWLPALLNSETASGHAAVQGVLDRALDRVLRLHPQSLTVPIVTALVYTGLEGAEAVGLWRQRRWAEYLTAVATAGFIPFEIHELLKRVSPLRVGTLVVNVAIVAWLVWAKGLFGLARGDDD